MSEENGKVCCNCQHCKRYHDEGGMCYCECEVDGHYIGYIACFENVCDEYKAESEDKACRDVKKIE